MKMTSAQLKELPEYSMTLPTGTTIGKKWRAHRVPGLAPINTPDCKTIFCGHWWQGQYARAIPPHDPEKEVAILWGKVELTDAPKAKQTWTPEED